MTSVDPYGDWDAAYLLGALSAADRREYESHLADCPACAAAVAGAAAIPGMLAKVPADEALALATGPAPGPEMPPGLLTGLVAAARRRRRRIRGLVGAGIAAAAVGAAALALVIPAVLAPGSYPSGPGGPGIALTQVVPSPLTARVRLVSEDWGTRIEMTCVYSAVSATDPPRYGHDASGYAMYVTDETGASTRVATWSASSGTTVRSGATTRVPADRIALIDIRSTATGQVLLEASPSG